MNEEICTCVECVIERAHAKAKYPATDFGHETGCPDTVGAAHIGRTCEEMRLLVFDSAIKRTLDASSDRWASFHKSVATGPHAPSLHGVYVRDNR